MAGRKPGTPKTGGRLPGTPNRTTRLLKDAILEAAEKAGDREGMVGYLTKQAKENPSSFLPLLGKVLPLQITGEGGGPVQITKLEFVVVDPEADDTATPA